MISPNRATKVPSDGTSPVAEALPAAAARGLVCEGDQDSGRVEPGSVPAAWVTSDEVYQDPQLCAELARLGLGYVLAVVKSHPVTTAIGPPSDELAKRLPAWTYQRCPVPSELSYRRAADLGCLSPSGRGVCGCGRFLPVDLRRSP
jgi:hypothetical protein